MIAQYSFELGSSVIALTAVVIINSAIGELSADRREERKGRRLGERFVMDVVRIKFTSLKTLLFHGKENSLISFPCFQLSSSSKTSFAPLLPAVFLSLSPVPKLNVLHAVVVCNCFVKFSLSLAVQLLVFALLTGGQGKRLM